MGNQVNLQNLRTEQEMECALTNYMRDTLSNNLEFKESKEEVNSITEAVHRMVDRVMEEVLHIDTRFEMFRKIPVGSMAEGTRIIQPDEFDFMIALKHFSLSGVVDIERGKKGTVFNDMGFAHVRLRDRNTLETWSDICQYINLKSGQESFGLRALFAYLVVTAIRHLLQTEFRKFHTCHGVLYIKNDTVRIHGPAVTLLTNWHSFDSKQDMDISVDLVAVIESNIGELVKMENTVFPYLFKILQQTGHIHLVPVCDSIFNDEKCFAISFAETEMSLVKNLNQNHKMCYKVLKDMFQTRKKIGKKVIKSFTLKTLIIQHACDCSETNTAGHCLLKVLNIIRNSYSLGFKSVVAPLFFYSRTLVEARTKSDDECVTELLKNVDNVCREYPLTPHESDQKQIHVQIQP